MWFSFSLLHPPLLLSPTVAEGTVFALGECGAEHIVL